MITILARPSARLYADRSAPIGQQADVHLLAVLTALLPDWYTLAYGRSLTHWNGHEIFFASMTALTSGLAGPQRLHTEYLFEISANQMTVIASRQTIDGGPRPWELTAEAIQQGYPAGEAINLISDIPIRLNYCEN